MTKRITLVRPSYSAVYSVYGTLPKNREIRPPLALLYIAAALEKDGHTVTVIDGEPKLMSVDSTFNEIIKTQPDIVGFTSTTPEFHFIEILTKKIKKYDSSVAVMVGGAHVSALPEDTARDCPEIDYIVCGEGERAASYVVKNLPSEKIISMPTYEDIDEIPLPARHLVDYKDYKYPMPGKGIVQMDVILSSRGCPFLCTFCANRSTKPRFRDPVKVVDEIENSYVQYSVKYIMFFDDTLTIKKQHVHAICDEIIKRDLHRKIVFYANTRANTTDFEVLKKMKLAGISEISTGVETGNPDMLKAIKKGTTHDQYIRLYKWMRKLGIQTRASFIVGFPHETHASVHDTIKFAKKIQLVRASCNILTPYPGTLVYKQAIQKDGLYLLCHDWKEFKRWGRGVVKTDELSQDDLEWYQKKFLAEFYSQPKVILYHLFQLLKGNFSLYYYRPVIFAIKNRLSGKFSGYYPPHHTSS